MLFTSLRFTKSQEKKQNMDISIQPFILISFLFVLTIEVVTFTRLTLQQPSESDNTENTDKIRKRRTRGTVFSFLLLLMMIIYYLISTYRSYREYYILHVPNLSPKNGRGLKLLEMWIESLQKSLLFYMTTLVIPFISSERFRTLHVEEDISEIFIEWYAFARVFSYPLIFIAFGESSAFGIYLVEVLSLSETFLLLFIYLLLLSKIEKLREILTHTQLVTKYEVEAVIKEIRPGICGFLLYLGLDLASRAGTIILIFIPERTKYSVISDLNSLVKIVLFVLLYHSIARLVFPSSKGACDSIEKMEHIKKHVAGSFLNLKSKDEDGMVPLNEIPSI